MSRQHILHTTPSQILAILLLTLLAGCTSAPVAERGDTVLVDYIGRYPNGTLFDTSIAYEAQNAGTYDARRDYMPLRVTIGDGEVIAGFEEALIGMRKGETKRAIITPEKGYGKRSASKVSTIPLIKTMPLRIVASREVRVPTQRFMVDHPDATEGSIIEQDRITYTVTTYGLDEVTLLRDAEPGEEILLPGTTWSSVVESVTPTAMTIRQQLEDGNVVRTGIAPGRVTIDGETATITLLLEQGGLLVHEELGTGIVTSVNATEATVDFNHPLAGETLHFELILIDVNR